MERRRLGGAGEGAGAPLIAIASVAIAMFFTYGRRPADRVHFEDAHVVHRGGELYPHQYTVARFLYSGGWIVQPGDSLSFQIRSGTYNLHYSASQPAMIELAGRAYQLRPEARTIPVRVDRTGRTELRCLSGEANLDRME